MNRAIIALAAVLAGIAASQARIITVDDDGPADFNNIQTAIDDANDGDTVLIADGRYTGAGNRDIDFHGKAITVKSQNGPENCIIDCNGTPSEPHRGFCFHSGEGPDSVLSGVTVTNGYAANGGGIYCGYSNPVIENCIITRNSAEDGGGIYWEASSSQSAALSRCVIVANRAISGGGIMFDRAQGVFENCRIVENIAVYEGGGVAVWIGNPLTFEGCTFARNSGQFGGGLWCVMGMLVLRNCILWGDVASIGYEVMLENENTMPPFGNVDIYYSDLEGGPAGVYDLSLISEYGSIKFREGNIDADPCFADPNNCDYHLKSQGGRYDPNTCTWVLDDETSRCIDAGDPMSPVGLEPFPNGGVVNMGAYAGSSEASKSYFDEPPCETIVAGDVNGDCIIDFLDFRLMALHWLEDR